MMSSQETLPDSMQLMLVQLIEMMVHQDQLHTRIFGDKKRVVPDFNSMIVVASSDVIKAASTQDLDLTKDRLSRLWKVVLDKLTYSPSVEKAEVINYIAPRMMSFVSIMSTPGDFLNFDATIHELNQLVRRSLTNEDLTIMTLSLVHVSISAGLKFPELFIRTAAEIALLNFRMDEKHLEGNYDNEADLKSILSVLLHHEHYHKYTNYEAIYAEIVNLYSQSQSKSATH